EDHGADRDDEAVQERAADAGGARAAEEHLVIVPGRGRPGDPFRRQLDDVLAELQRGDEHPHHRYEPEQSQRDQADGEDQARRVQAQARGGGHAQYSVWPRSRRICSTEKPSTTANRTHAIAEAAPNWKKFWNAVS